ncbi:MAG TPA: MgtC/SapB family protein [Planctomycetota bacterium]
MDTNLVLARFGVAFVLAFALGLVRQKLGKPVGFGTFIFVALGSCALALTAKAVRPNDPLPLLGSVVTGVGFLGAGALFRTADRVVGFTSAATIWICAVFGLTLGIGQYSIAALVYAAIWMVIAVDHLLQSRWLGVHERKLTVELRLGLTSDDYARLGLPPLDQAQSMELDRGQHRLVATFSIDRPPGHLADYVQALGRADSVLGLRLE